MDSKTDKENFSGVGDTLYLPLAARATFSRRFPTYFYDQKSVDLENLPEVKRVKEKSSEYSFIASVSRYRCTDKFVKDFIEEKGSSQIVNLGAGLESLNYRISDKRACYFSLDLPDVIELRKKVLGIGENETMIWAVLPDLSWLEKLDRDLPTLFIASGVFQYFEESDVIALIKGLQQSFKGGVLVFDATDKVGVRYAERYVKKTGNQSAAIKFHVDDPKEFCRQAGVELLECRGFYKEAQEEIGKKLKLYTRIAMKVADDKKRTILLRIRL